MVTPEYILSLVKRLSGVDIIERNRNHDIVIVRWVYYILCKELCFTTNDEITRLIGQTVSMASHSSGRRKMILNNPKTRLLYNTIHSAASDYILEHDKLKHQNVSTYKIKKNIQIEIKLMDNLYRLSNKLLILEDLLELSESELLDFKESRINPYIAMNKRSA